jgi:hypothetical protein
MTLENKLLEIKFAFFNAVSYIVEKIAKLFFNYPNNPGMPIIELTNSTKKEMIDYKKGKIIKNELLLDEIIIKYDSK